MVENVSTHKTKIELVDVENFLSKFSPQPVTNLEIISGGEGSQAFSYEANGQSFVILINKHSDNGFKKDRYAYENFASANLQIPEVVEIGQLNNGNYFCISKKSKGVTLNKYSKDENREILPEIFKMLDEIHSVDISDKNGFGNWDAEGNTDKEKWSDFLLGADKWAKKLFEENNPILEKDVWDKIYTRFLELIPYCTEERYLVHADVGFDNLLAKDGKITGVIDWENSKYGDFVYDISWLCFWSSDEERNTKIEEYYKDLPNFQERLLCYKLLLGMDALSFYAYSNQKSKYDFAKGKLLELIK